jgi:hypothetical protein
MLCGAESDTGQSRTVGMSKTPRRDAHQQSLEPDFDSHQSRQTSCAPGQIAHDSIPLICAFMPRFGEPASEEQQLP